eukprot:4061546-Prymnesium_polylepis.1
MLYFATLSGFSVHLSHAHSELTTLRQCVSFWRELTRELLWAHHAPSLVAHSADARVTIPLCGAAHVLMPHECPSRSTQTAGSIGSAGPCGLGMPPYTGSC